MKYRAYRHSQGRVQIAGAEANLDLLGAAHNHVILVRPHYTGICSADVREVRGERPGRCDFGHEVVGAIVDSTHPHLKRGDTVVLNPFIKIDRETAFAEVMYAAGSAEVLTSALLEVPSTDLHYALVEPLACAIHAAHRSLTDNREPKLVLGAGFFGYLLYCYLETQGVPVRLANRSADRLAHLAHDIPTLQVVDDLEQCASDFSTVFITQARMTGDDIGSAARLLRNDGEIVLFAAIDRSTDPELHAARSGQQRISWSEGNRGLFLQGTLDASLADLQEAIAMLGEPEFRRKVSPVLATPLTFEQGADHLTRRAQSPRAERKYLIDMMR